MDNGNRLISIRHKLQMIHEELQHPRLSSREWYALEAKRKKLIEERKQLRGW